MERWNAMRTTVNSVDGVSRKSSKSASRKSARARNYAPPTVNDSFAAPRPTVPIAPSVPTAPQPLKLMAAKAGDHPSIQFFLQSIFHAPSANEFHQQQEEPGYEPQNRIIVRDGAKVVGHVRLVRTELNLGGGVVPAAKICDLAVDAALRGQGLATALLKGAEQQARSMGISVLLARSDRHRLFARQGFATCGRHSYSYAGPRAILAEIERRRLANAVSEVDLISQGPVPRPLTVRRWRHVEQNAPPRLFSQQFAGVAGVGERSADYWRWLIARQAYDFFYVCIEGRDRMELDNQQASLVGYAFVKQGRVVELARADGRDDVAAALLKRACGDAIEEEAIEVRLDAPAHESLHEWITTAGGTLVHTDCDGQQRYLAKILSMTALAEHLPRLAEAKPIDNKPRVLGFSIRDDIHPERAEIGIIEIVDGCPRWIGGRGTSSLVKCRRSTFTQLVLGHLTVDQAMTEGHLETTQKAGEKLLREIFPDRVWWSPPLPDLLA